MVLTVTGPVEPKQLGITLMHEHLLVDLTSFFVEPSLAKERRRALMPVSMEVLGCIRWSETSNLDNLSLQDEKVAVEEVTEFKLRGGSTVVDATPVEIGRNPLGLKRIAEKARAQGDRRAQAITSPTPTRGGLRESQSMKSLRT